MNAVKIEIKRELVKIGTGPILREVIMPPCKGEMLEEGAAIMSSKVKSECIEYQSRTIYNEITGERKYFYVRAGDNEIFNDLLRIGDDDIKQDVFKKVNSIRKRMDHEFILKEAELKAELIQKMMERNLFKRIFNIF